MNKSREVTKITGHLGADAELKQIEKRKSQVISFPVVINLYYRDKNKNLIETVKTYYVTRWYPAGKNVEKMLNALKKGALVVCEGQLNLKPYINKEGEAVCNYTIDVDVIDILRFAKKSEGSISEEQLDHPEVNASSDDFEEDYFPSPIGMMEQE